MSDIDSGNPPECVGNPGAFVLTFTPPDTTPAAVVSAVVVNVCKPDGSVVPNDGTTAQISPNVWSYSGTTVMSAPGRWTWQIIATGSLSRTREAEIVLPASRFT